MMVGNLFVLGLEVAVQACHHEGPQSGLRARELHRGRGGRLAGLHDVAAVDRHQHVLVGVPGVVSWSSNDLSCCGVSLS